MEEHDTNELRIDALPPQEGEALLRKDAQGTFYLWFGTFEQMIEEEGIEAFGVPVEYRNLDVSGVEVLAPGCPWQKIAV
jgi:hypothetical protein